MNRCSSCGAETSNPKYCSRSCSARENNKTPKRTKRKQYCYSCGEPIETKGGTRRKYCDACFRKDTLSDETLGKIKEERRWQYNNSIRTHARSVVAKVGAARVCAICGYDKHVEVCHIRSISDFSDDATISEINSLSNLILLCPNCHWEFDRDLLGLGFTEFDDLHL